MDTEATHVSKAASSFQKVRIYLYIPFYILAAFVFGTFICSIGIVTSDSMAPTVPSGHFTVCNRLDASYDRGDVICFQMDQEKVFKRIIGLPGETVSFSDGDVYIDGTLLDESSYLPLSATSDASQPSYRVPDNSYFVMGDNRTISIDSREWETPYIAEESIIGVLLFHLPLPFL